MMTDPLGRALTALVVDDEVPVRHLWRRTLHQMGFETLAADSTRSALALVQGTVPDCVVTDLNMPEVGGVELCRQLRSNPATRHVPIIVVSASKEEDLQKAIEAGCDVVLQKPCSPRTLEETIRRLLTLAPPEPRGPQSD
jgi:two-component system phosphate regulon response regulator PhoB